MNGLDKWPLSLDPFLAQAVTLNDATGHGLMRQIEPNAGEG
jgi:hypothetical protein